MTVRQANESGREKPSSVHQHPENEDTESFGNALPPPDESMDEPPDEPMDEQIPENVLDAMSLVLEGLSQWERELRKKGGRG